MASVLFSTVVNMTPIVSLILYVVLLSAKQAHFY